MRNTLMALGLIATATLASAQAQHKTIPLWPKGAPGSQGSEAVDVPAVIEYPAPPSANTGTAIVVIPGGGYTHLAMDHEGVQIAEWLNQRGISAFILRYRLGPKYHHPVQIGDGQRAVRWTRAHAKEFGYKADQIGVWGFSAGGHLASTLGTHFDSAKTEAADEIDKQSSRPDFMILAYPVITMEDDYVHAGSRKSLLGENPTPEQIELLSNEKHVTKETPPTFLFHTTADPVVPVQNSVNFYLALVKAGVPAEMHIYERGRHGVGLAGDDPVLRTWPGRLDDWLKVHKWR